MPSNAKHSHDSKHNFTFDLRITPKKLVPTKPAGTAGSMASPELTHRLASGQRQPTQQPKPLLHGVSGNPNTT